MASQSFAPLARSPITPPPPVQVLAGWEVSARQTTAALTLTDCTPLAKVQVKAPEAGAVAATLGVAHLEARRDEPGALVVGSGPGEWLMLAPPGTAPEVTARLEARLSAVHEFWSVVDLTHARALLRLTGPDSAATLAKVCGIDLSEHVTLNGAAFRSSVARLVTDVVRDDRDDVPSYLLHCEISAGQYLFDALLDAGEEFGIDVDGLTHPGI